MAKRVMVGMSGGVDSSAAALLLQRQGYEVVGATFHLFCESDLLLEGQSRCCSADDINDARLVCDRLGIPHYVLNYKDQFREWIIDPFVREYLSGATPNPCIACNRHIKFEAFLSAAQSMGFDYIATGHYARAVTTPEGRFALLRALHPHKDQSYVLYHLTQQSLSHLLLPLGEYEKPAVRALAEENGLLVASKPDSQDICFVPNGDYASFIAAYTGAPPKEGVFTDKAGKILGRHGGVQHFTVGQRKGLGISLGRPVFVTDIDAAAGTVVLGEEAEVFSRALVARDVNLIDGRPVQRPFACSAKIRYSHREDGAMVYPEPDGALRVIFRHPQRAITRGQAVVLYDSDRILGGGTITEFGNHLLRNEE